LHTTGPDPADVTARPFAVTANSRTHQSPLNGYAGSPHPIRVVLGDDNLIAREGLLRVLERIPGVEVVATCSDLPSLRAAAVRLSPDVVLTDIRMPPTQTDEGIQLAAELRTTLPDVAVVLVSQHAEPTYALGLFEGGAERRGYLLKERVRDQEDLERALREVVSGGSLVDPIVVSELLEHGRRTHGSLLSRLTPRDTQILALLAEGRSNGAIAEALGISKRAVERHVGAIFARLELKDAHSVDRRVKAALLYLDGRPL
jgi:DNA-binding NarL/FixJ family response regulator